MALPLPTLYYHGLQYLPQGKGLLKKMKLICVLMYNVLSSLMLHRPLQFVDLTKLKTEKSHLAFHPSNNTGVQVQTNASFEEARSVALISYSEKKNKFSESTMQDNVIEDIGAAADELEDITERFIQSVGVNAVESMMTFRGGRHFLYFIVRRKHVQNRKKP